VFSVLIGTRLNHIRYSLGNLRSINIRSDGNIAGAYFADLRKPPAQWKGITRQSGDLSTSCHHSQLNYAVRVPDREIMCK
jgi:hypothetical protein